MASRSLALSRGVSGTKISDFTAGTTAPASGDFQICWNTTDTNGKTVTHMDVILACEAFIRALEQGGATVDVILLSGAGTSPPPV